MDKQKKIEFYYQLWEFHANLLWNRVQYLIVVMAGFYTAWFLLFQLLMKNNKYDCIYLILNLLLCLFGIVICYNFFKLSQRDIKHQQYYEEKLPELFSEIKGEYINRKTRGRYIFSRLLKTCMCSCVVLSLFSIICFIIK